MALTSLLVCADAETVQVLSRILDDLDVAVELCGNLAMASARIDDRHFDAILVDCAAEQDPATLIAHIRTSPANQNAIAVAIVNGENHARSLFEAGANFILYKPVSHERAWHSIRAARSLMRRERRARPRIPIKTSASIAYPGTEHASADLLDLSDEGVALHYDRQLPPRCKVYFQFALPGNRALVQLSGEVMWQDSAGRMGIRFAHVPQTSRRILKDWLHTKAPKPTAVPTDECHSEQSSHTGTIKEDPSLRLSAGLGLLAVSSGDRRNRSRQACSLGAEVYRVGNSVPVRCTLADISRGGCYVETTEPFPAGTPLEIVVRTADLKLLIYGKVKGVNAGVGMGVEFNLRTPDQRTQLEQLLDRARLGPKLPV